MTDITEYRLEIEWDRKINTGSYSRHKSMDEAIEELKEMTANDPADSFKICKVRTITEEIRLPNALITGEAKPTPVHPLVGQLTKHRLPNAPVCPECRGSGIRIDFGRYGYPCARCHGHCLDNQPNATDDGAAK